MDETGPNRLIGRASIVAAGIAYQQGISFLSGLIVARVIGAANYGVFNLARSLVDLTGILTRLGLDIGLQRYFGETSTTQDSGARVITLRRVRLLASAFALLPIAAIALGLGRTLEADVYHYSNFAEILLCLALSLPFLTDIAVLGGAYRGILKLAPSVIAESIMLPTIRLAVIVILFSIGWRLWAVVVGTTLGSILAAAFLALRARADFRRVVPARTHSWADVTRVMSYSVVLALALLVTTLTNNVDVLMLGRFASAQDVGQYTLVKMLLTLMNVFGAAFVTGLGALVAERYFRGDRSGMVRVMSLSARWVTLTTLPLFSIFLFWGAPLTQLFGSSFGASQAVVGWLATSQFIFVVFGPSGWALSMTGRHVLELKILSIGLAVAAALCWLAAPAYGQLGAAVATCASMAFTNFVRILFVRRSIGAFPFGLDIFAIMPAGAGIAWISDLLASQFPFSGVWRTVCGIACFILAYGVVAWTHWLNETEKRGISTALEYATRKLSLNWGKATSTQEFP
ncbi:MAG: oligosaccharide flippase family protein [Betaproteobacteria bacterium]|nr:oligosaccharide flippase family protein [Betaproteobacteria bacterium]